MRKGLILFIVLATGVVWAAPVAPAPLAKAAFDRGEKALEGGNFDEALKQYDEALKVTPGYAAALNSRGSALFKQGKKEDALASFKAATEADPAFKLAWFNLGYAARKTNDFTGAAVAYEKYTALDANDPDGFYGLAESYKGSNQREKAIAAYDTYLAKEKRPDQAKWVAKATESRDALKAAAPAAAAPAPAVAAAPAGPDTSQPIPALVARRVADGDKLMADKNFRDASFAYQDAANADPSNVEVLFKLGRAYAILGQYSQAIANWNKVVQLSTDEAVRKLAQDSISKAEAKMAQGGGGSPQEAGKAPGSGPIADTTRTQARQFYEQAVQFIGQRRYSEALGSLNSCLKLEPALSVGYIARGSALIGLSRFAEAAVDYNYALKLEPALSSPLYGLAEAYRGMNRIDDARGYYQRYVTSTAADLRPELKTDAQKKLETLR